MSNDEQPPKPVMAFDKEAEKKVEKKETHVTIQNTVPNAWKIRGSAWLTSLSLLTPQQIRKKFAIDTGRYLAFLILFSVITLAPRDEKHTFLMTFMLRDYFTNEQLPSQKTYNMIHTVDEFWDYFRSIVLVKMYPDTNPNGQPFTDIDRANSTTYLLNYNKIVGAIRLRQIRVKQKNCDLVGALSGTVHNCYAIFSDGEEETDDWYLNGTRFQWYSSKELHGYSHWGEMGWYPGGGYILDIPSNDPVLAKEEVDRLWANNWIDQQTRVVFIELTVFNANLNLHTMILLVAEFPASGGMIPGYSFRTERLFLYTTARDYVVLAVELIFILMLVYYIYEEVIEIMSEKWKYFTQGWNYVDWANIICFIVVIGMRISQVAVVSTINFKPEPTHYINYQSLAFNVSQEQNINAFNGLICWIKIFKYIHIFPKMKLLTTTLMKSARSVIYFLIMFFVVFLGFVFGLYISVGKDVQSFSSIQNSMFTLFEATLGQFNFDELRQANRILGPFLFVTYMLLVFFVFVNMFIAIVNRSYEEEILLYKDSKNKEHVVEEAILGFVKAKFSSLRQSIIKRYTGYQTQVLQSDKDGDGTLNKEELKALKAKFSSNREITQLIEEADKNHDDRLSIEETAALLNQIEQKMKQQVTNVENAEKLDQAMIKSSSVTRSVPELRLITSSGGAVTDAETNTTIESSNLKIMSPKGPPTQQTNAPTLIELNNIFVNNPPPRPSTSDPSLISSSVELNSLSIPATSRMRNLESTVMNMDLETKAKLAELNNKIDKVLLLLQKIGEDTLDFGIIIHGNTRR